MLTLYNLALRSYALLLRLLAPLLPKAAAWVAGRRGLLAHIGQIMGNEPAERVWFHCASLGEFEQGRPLMEAYRQRHPEVKIVLTFFSPSGYEVRKRWPGADYIFYLPLDTRRHAQTFFDAVQPQLVVFVKYEFWYHFLNEARRRDIPAVVVSAIFRPDQVFFQPWGGFFRQVLGRFSHIFTQNQASADLLARLPLPHTQVSVAGDTRFDTVAATAAAPPRSLPLVDAFTIDLAPVLVAGSVWPEDISVLTPLLQQRTEMRTIVAPHEISEATLRQVEAALPGQVVRYSQADIATVAQARILLIDNVGLLSQLYRFGHYAYIGGAFGKGLHNTLEAAAFGLPLFFGPNYHRFQEAVDLVDLHCALPVENATEMLAAFNALRQDETRRLRLQDIALEYIHTHAGATEIVMSYELRFVPMPSKR